MSLTDKIWLLASLSRRLNDATAELNDVLVAFERRLLSLGVVSTSVWYPLSEKWDVGFVASRGLVARGPDGAQMPLVRAPRLVRVQACEELLSLERDLQAQVSS